MSDFGSHPKLSAHAILRFSIEQARMRDRHAGLHHDRGSISLRDDSTRRNLRELMQVRNTVRIARFLKLRPPSFDGRAANRFEGTIMPERFTGAARRADERTTEWTFSSRCLSRRYAALDEPRPGN